MLVYDHCDEEQAYAAAEQALVCDGVAEQALACDGVAGMACDDDVVVLV